MKRILAALAALVLAVPVFAQTWSAPHVIDTGWQPVNDAGCTPESYEPAFWSRADVSLPPDGTDLVRYRSLQLEYRTTIEVTNTSPVPVFCWGNGTVQARVGHLPGIYQFGSLNYAAGHGWDSQTAMDALVASPMNGGSTFSRVIDAGETDWILSYSQGSQSAVLVEPIEASWFETNRRDAHSLFTTVVGGYSWNWSWGAPVPPGWSHAPLTYSMQTEARHRYSIEWGSYP